ncbi:MAG: hypothetical protein JSW60_03855 [Thermoplasmatales archaeon]|nr:MAG: hypothetical protein JSW60_03855 [Thermoplasmatales archaeon]
MNKKILIGSILAAILIVLASITSVVGNSVVKSDVEKRSVVSPLFAVRSERFIKSGDTEKVSSNYLGKGKTLSLLFPTKAPLHGWINKALKIIENRPNVLDTIFARLDKTPEFINLLEAYNVDINDFKNDMTQVKNDPSLLKEMYEEAEQVLGDHLELPLNDPIEPLGLLGEWQPGLLLVTFLLFISILPIFLLLGVVIATMTIITCLNINNCFESVMSGVFAILAALIQGLKQPVS